MPIAAEQLEELKSNIAFARKRPLAFGLCLGKSAETTVLLGHKTKDPEAIGRQAKKDGETNKIAFGTMACEGKNLMLNCQGDVPTGIARKTKELLKLAGLKFKVMILDAEGNTLEEDGDEEEEGEGEGQDDGPAVTEAPEAGGGADPAAADDPQKAKWAEAKPKVEAVLEKTAAEGKADLTAANETWASAKAAAEAENFAQAIKQAGEVVRLIGEAVAAANVADADRDRWIAASGKILPLIDEVVAAATPEAPKIRAVWSFALSKAEGNPPDFATAIKSIGMLVKLIGDARAAIAAKGGAAPAGAPAPDLVAADGDPVPEPAALPAGGAGAPAGAPGGTPPAGTPPAGPPPAGDAAPAGGPGSPPAPDVAAAPGGAPADLKGTTDDKIKRAEDQIKAIEALIVTYDGLIPGSAEPSPPAWAAEKARIAGIVATEKAKGAGADAAKLDTALKDLATFEKSVTDKSAEKAKWKAALDLFQLRLVPLDRHAQAAAVPQIKPKIDAIKADMAAAVAKADAQDFKGATTQLTPLAARCDTVEALADAFAHYSTILTQRQNLVAPLNGIVTGTAAVDTLIRQIETLLAGAATDATAEKYADGVKKLDQIPPIDEKLRRIFADKAKYDANIANIDPRLAAIEALPANVKATVTTELANFKTLYAAGKIGVTNDYVVSQGLISRLFDHLGYLESTTTAATAWLAALALFEPQFTIFKDHKGRPGIEEFFLGLQSDYDQGKAEAGSNKHATATAILTRTQARWPAEKTNADNYLLYTDKRTLVVKAIDDQRPRDGAAPAVAQADALMATAVTNATAKDYTTALANVNEAEKRALDAKAAADAKAALGALKDGAALDGMAADFDKAFKVWTDMRANVAAKDAGGTLAALFKPADDRAKLAQDEKAKPAPDFNVARAHLDAAIAELDGVLAKVLAKAPFDAHLAEVRTLVTGTLTPLNIDDCIKTAIEGVTKLANDAEALAKTPGFDFAGGEAKLTEARAAAQKAQTNGGLWPAIKADRATTASAKAAIAADPVALPLMTARTARIDKLLAELDAAKTAGDFPTAAAKGKEGAGLLAPTQRDITTCNTVATNKANWVDAAGRLPAITGAGKEAALPKLAIVNTKLGQFQTMMTAGNFDGASNLLNEIYWDIQDGLTAVAEHATYETARALAQSKLDSARAVRNAGIEKELVVIEARYDAAVAAASGPGKYRTPEAEMTAIGPLCDPLLVKAAAWKTYDDARLPARAKLDAVVGHPEAPAVQPMITRLEAKYAAAVKQAEGGDPASAKTAMDEVGTAADEAMKSADASKAFADTADALAGGDPAAGPDAAQIKKAEEMLAALKARPEAPAAAADLKEATTQITNTQVSGDPAGSKAALIAAMDACKRADEVMSQHKMVDQAATAAKAKLADLKTHAQTAFIAADIAQGTTMFDDVVKTSLAGSGGDQASANLEVAMKVIDDAKAVADAQAAYLAFRAKPGVEPRLEVLEKHNHRYAIKANIDTIRTKLKSAADKAAERKHPEAMTLLAEVEKLGLSSLVLADMRENKPPSVADVKAILAGPGGDAELDAMVAQLEPDAQRAVLRVAFEARFGCALENFNNPAMAPANLVADMALTGPNIKRFYDVMADLPTADTRGNDSLRKFKNVEAGPGGSSYSGNDKAIVMNEGDAAFSGAYGFGREHEVGSDVEPDCKPANQEPVSFFSWNTLHEVGHAVDDKHGFMDKNGSGATYGGWTMYGRNVQPIADKLATKFKYDATYIGQYMERNNNPAIPEQPGGVSPEEWEARRVAVRAHIDSAKVGNSPWGSASIAARLVIDGVVYQESYDNRWSSYSFAARKQAMTGYQFRAPGEWFAELYAAYHSGKLKDTHPAAVWLATL